MLLDKPILGVLDRTPYLGLIEILWGKADCFSLTTHRDMPEEICIQASIIRVEENTIYCELNSQTKSLFKMLTGFLDFCMCSWCDLKFYSGNQILLAVTTHEGGIEIDSQIYQEFLAFCEKEYEKDESIGNDFKKILLYHEMETADLSDSVFCWKRNDDSSSFRVEIEKSGKRYTVEYRFPVEFISDIPEGKQVVAQEIEFGSQAGIGIGSRSMIVFTLSIVTNPPKLFKYKDMEVEETSLSIMSLEIFMM